MRGVKERSKNEKINAGYFQGLQEEIHRRTGITKPVIHKAIRDNDMSSSKKFLVIATALEIIEERKKGMMETVEEPVISYETLDLNRLYQYADYLRWQFKERVELIRGRIFKMSPAPAVNHQAILSSIQYEFYRVFLHGNCKVFPAPFDVRLQPPGAPENTTVVQPDITIICDISKLDSKGCKGTPDLVVEILSHSNQKHDLERKFELYQACGIPEYWIVYPVEKMVLVYHLVNGIYEGSRPYTEGMTAESRTFHPLKIPVKDIFIGVLDFE